MIVGVPDHALLNATAIGWMNLAWDITIGEAADFKEAEFLYQELEDRDGPNVATLAIEKHWRAKQLTLSNAVSLLQQSLEIALKARIAEVSPFLLIAGDVRSWPQPKDGNDVEFSQFKTIDASQLYDAAKIVSEKRFNAGLKKFYDRLRTARNTIVHLDGGGLKIEVGAILAEIITAQRYLFGPQKWPAFRLAHLNATEQYADNDAIFSGDDYTGNAMAREMETALAILNSQQRREFFGFNDSKRAYSCPECRYHLEDSDHYCGFVQAIGPDRLQCIVCEKLYSVDDYKDEALPYYEGMGPGEFAEIIRDLDEIANTTS